MKQLLGVPDEGIHLVARGGRQLLGGGVLHGVDDEVLGVGKSRAGSPYQGVVVVREAAAGGRGGGFGEGKIMALTLTERRGQGSAQ